METLRWDLQNYSVFLNITVFALAEQFIVSKISIMGEFWGQLRGWPKILCTVQSTPFVLSLQPLQFPKSTLGEL